MRDTIIHRLRFLSKLEEGMKPCFTDNTIILTSSYWQWFKRKFIKGERRTDIIYNVEQIIRDAIKEINANSSIRHLLIVEIRNARAGITTLLETYKDDPYFCVQISVVISEIDHILKS